MTMTSALVCNMNVFTPAQRENHIQNIAQLFQSVQEIHEVPNGYQFMFPANIELTQLADFISEERLCCPFLEFTLKIEPKEKKVSLTLVGPTGTQEFLREEFNEIFV
jgi:hypothetical protein